MRCPECLGTKFDAGLYTMAQIVHGKPVVLTNVPADRCRQCGHDLLSSETANKIARTLERPADSLVQAPEYNLANTPDQRSSAASLDEAPTASTGD